MKCLSDADSVIPVRAGARTYYVSAPSRRLWVAAMRCLCCQAQMDKDELTQKIGAVAAKLPEWVRHDLAAADRTVRERAEETLAAILAAALENSQ